MIQFTCTLTKLLWFFTSSNRGIRNEKWKHFKSDKYLIWLFGWLTFTSLYLTHVTELESKRLSTCIGSTYSMYRSNFSLYRITLYINDRKRLHLFYARRGETSRDLTYSLHSRTRVVSKCRVVWKTVPFHDKKLMKSTLSIPQQNVGHCVKIHETSPFLGVHFWYKSREFQIWMCQFTITYQVVLHSLLNNSVHMHPN